MPAENIQFNHLFNAAKTFFKEKVEPCQPLVATITIVAKAIYKSRAKKQISEKIERLKGHLRLIHSSEEKDHFSPVIERLEYQLKRTETDQIHTRIAFLQLFSLLFAHPGSNFWNSIITLIGRLFSIRHHFTHIEEDPQNKMNGVLGIISTMGTIAALLKQTGAIQEYPLICHAMIGASFISMAIEGSLMAKNWLSAQKEPSRTLSKDSS